LGVAPFVETPFVGYGRKMGVTATYIYYIYIYIYTYIYIHIYKYIWDLVGLKLVDYNPSYKAGR
jgi:hypothetical protein